MSDGESIVETPRPTESGHDASDESGAESEPEAVRARLRRAERELQALRCPLLRAELPAARYALRDLLPAVRDALPHADDGFLADYLAVLRERSPRDVHAITCEVMSSIEDALRGAAEDASCAPSAQRVVLCAFLCAASLSDAPRVPDARPALRQLLAHTSAHERVQLARLWWRALPAAALLQLSDAARAPRPPDAPDACDAPSLAELLLRAALCRLPPHERGAAEPQWERGAPRLEELGGALEEGARAGLDAARVALCGRVLAAAPRALRPALLRRLHALPHHSRATDAPAPASKVGVCKLQILFGADEKILREPRGRARPRPQETHRPDP